MSVDEDDASETVVNEILGEPGEEIEISSRSGGKRSGKIEVVMRVSQPHQRSEKGFIADFLMCSPDDFAQQKAVREER